MDFNYSEEQQMLFDSVGRFGLERFPASDRLRILAGGTELAAQHWREMAELGWLMLAMTEEQGGLGGGPIEVMALAEGMGRHLITSPYVASCVLAPALLTDGSDAAQSVVAAIGAGETIVAAALLETDGGYDLNRVDVRAERKDNGYALNGVKSHVEDGADAAWFLVSARTSGAGDELSGISLFLVAHDAPGLLVRRFRSIDGHRHASLALNNVTGAKLIGAVDEALPVIEAAVARAVCANLSEATGSMEAVSAATLEYLKTRQQFGQPIGNFQVLQHRMVDMTIACEEARGMTCHATLNVHLEPAEWFRAVSAGKVRVSECGLYVGQQAVQLHGGVGFSDELIVSHHLKRQMMLAQAFGSIDYYRMRFAA